MFSEEILSSRHQMEESHKSSGSTRELRPLSLNNIKAGPLKSQMAIQTRITMTSECGAPTLDGGSSSDTEATTSRMSTTRRASR